MEIGKASEWIADKLNKPLWKGQGIPVVGPFIVAPIQIGTSSLILAGSLVTAITSATLAVFSLIGAVACKLCRCENAGLKCTGFTMKTGTLAAASGSVALGALEVLAYSLCNICSFGYFACKH